MLHENKLYFIDYQGGRKGALPYDVASLLYDAKADLPQNVREALLNHYIELLLDKLPEQAAAFKNYFYGFVLIRLMQAMGSYGFRGFYERKPHFLQSIPYALKNLEYLLSHTQLPIEIPHLWGVLSQLPHSETLQQYSQPKLKETPKNSIRHCRSNPQSPEDKGACPLAKTKTKLTVTINSFSFKNEHPVDTTGNGGGFVFDCRCLPNPGRCEKYNSLTGKDAPVIAYLEKEESVNQYFETVKQLIDIAIKNYTERNFENLSISFGCTGGRHRSVYFAEKMQKHINQIYTVNTKLNHLMENRWDEDRR